MRWPRSSTKIAESRCARAVADVVGHELEFALYQGPSPIRSRAWVGTLLFAGRAPRSGTHARLANFNRPPRKGLTVHRRRSSPPRFPVRLVVLVTKKLSDGPEGAVGVPSSSLHPAASRITTRHK